VWLHSSHPEKLVAGLQRVELIKALPSAKEPREPREPIWEAGDGNAYNHEVKERKNYNWFVSV